MAVISKDIKRLAQQPWFPVMMKELGYEPTKHGHWIDEQAGRWIYAKCSLCRTVHNVKSNYCPNCGAKMDGREE